MSGCGHLLSVCVIPPFLSCRQTVQRLSALKPCQPWSWPSRSPSWTISSSEAFPTSECGPHSCRPPQAGPVGLALPLFLRQMCVHRGVSLNLTMVWSDVNAFWSQFMLEMLIWKHRGLSGWSLLCFFMFTGSPGCEFLCTLTSSHHRNLHMAATMVLKLHGA